jgi:hypothetical protein
VTPPLSSATLTLALVKSYEQFKKEYELHQSKGLVWCQVGEMGGNARAMTLL